MDLILSPAELTLAVKEYVHRRGVDEDKVVNVHIRGGRQGKSGTAEVTIALTERIMLPEAPKVYKGINTMLDKGTDQEAPVVPSSGILSIIEEALTEAVIPYPSDAEEEELLEELEETVQEEEDLTEDEVEVEVVKAAPVKSPFIKPKKPIVVEEAEAEAEPAPIKATPNPFAKNKKTAPKQEVVVEEVVAEVTEEEPEEPTPPPTKKPIKSLFGN